VQEDGGETGVVNTPPPPIIVIINPTVDVHLPTDNNSLVAEECTRPTRHIVA
jgi:hypothetical protein